jgi:hypothetical protein
MRQQEWQLNNPQKAIWPTREPSTREPLALVLRSGTQKRIGQIAIYREISYLVGSVGESRSLRQDLLLAIETFADLLSRL